MGSYSQVLHSVTLSYLINWQDLLNFGTYLRVINIFNSRLVIELENPVNSDNVE